MVSGGEGEIRTLGTSFPVHSLSRRAPSASSVTSPFYKLAEEVGFEPTKLLHLTVFKTAAFSHSATPPKINPKFISSQRNQVNR